MGDEALDRQAINGSHADLLDLLVVSEIGMQEEDYN